MQTTTPHDLETDIQELIISLLTELINTKNISVNEAINAETNIFGETAILDSLDLVELIVSLEDEIFEKFDVEIIVVDESSIVDENPPFETVGSLTKLIYSRVSNEK